MSTDELMLLSCVSASGRTRYCEAGENRRRKCPRGDDGELVTFVYIRAYVSIVAGERIEVQEIYTMVRIVYKIHKGYFRMLPQNCRDAMRL